MATVTGLTAERMIAIEDASIVGGTIVGDNLVLSSHGGDDFIAGNVRGPEGPAGPPLSQLNDAGDVVITSPSPGQFLQWDGSAWVNASPFFPTGIIAAYGNGTPPTGFLMCDGAAFPAGTLYNALRTMYGTNAPDLRARFIRGAGPGNAVLGTGGADSVTLDSSNVPAHTHAGGTLSAQSAGGHAHTLNNLGGQPMIRFVFGGGGGMTVASASGGPLYADNYYTTTDGDHAHSIVGATAGYGAGGSHENRPAYTSLFYIVKI